MLGDIILLRSAGLGAKRNLLAQRMVTGRFTFPEGFTHVAIGSGPWQAIHAMPSPWHIEFAGIHELLLPGEPWQVWRKNSFRQKIKREPWLEQSLHYEFSKCIGDEYNDRFFLRDDRDYSYCSQLVGKLTALMGCPFAKRPSALMPLDIAAEVRRSWSEVTSQYQKVLDEDYHYRRLHLNPNQRDASAHFAAYLHAKASNNAMERGFMATAERVGPKSRVEVRDYGSAAVIESLEEEPPAGLNGSSTMDLPEAYHGSIVEWDRVIGSATQWMSDDEWEEFKALELPGRGIEGDGP